MERVPGRGEVIFLRFPHTDLTDAKNRPGVVLAQLPDDDILVCQVTSRDRQDPFAVAIQADCFSEGGLPIPSFARADRLFTAHASVVTKRVGRLREDVIDAIIEKVVSIVKPLHPGGLPQDDRRPPEAPSIKHI